MFVLTEFLLTFMQVIINLEPYSKS